MSLLRHAGCVLLGVLVALAAIGVHRTAFPLGGLLAVTTTLALAGRLLVSRRPDTAGSYAAGWLAFFGLVVIGRPEGDYVLASDAAGVLLMLGAFVLVAMGVVAVAGGRRAR